MIIHSCFLYRNNEKYILLIRKLFMCHPVFLQPHPHALLLDKLH